MVLPDLQATMSLCLKSFRVNLISFPCKDRDLWAHPIVNNVAFKKSRGDHFFHYTENSTEISIIADVNTISTCFTKTKNRNFLKLPGVYRVFQIDNQLADSPSKRINEISLNLATEGISIFYLCTYQTDFLLVQESSVQTAVEILNGWAKTLSKANQLEFLIELENGKIIPLSASLSRELLPASSATSVLIDDVFRYNVQKLSPQFISNSRLTMAGLNSDLLENWALDMIRLLLYPDNIKRSSDSVNDPLASDRFISFTTSSEGASVIAEDESLDYFDSYLLNRDQDSTCLRLIQISLNRFDQDSHGLVHTFSHPFACTGIDLLYLSTFGTANLLIKDSDIEEVTNILQALNNDS
ncbi:hypothetical protein DSO57_1010524 [Entomophthora muscae]|uniref:Uncharacterized protein n=1 Tax=Entomophthora muscae TaxID=34485 RepID=A0ACC2U5M7_9FUNG|nr:hypothetical protein DSO57_1010524 [Entomophthora muscae]